MLKVLFICLHLCTVFATLNESNRLRRQSPFADGIQPPLYKYEPRRILPTNAHRKSESNYMIVGPKIIRPLDIVSVWVTILNEQWSTTNVAVSLFNQHDEIAAGEQRLLPRIPTAIIFQVPQNAPNGSYKIYVRGTLLDSDVVFYNETNVIFHAKSLSIFIQLDKPMYRHEQLVRFRCIPVYSDLRGYFSTINVYIIGPMNNILRRWHNLQTTWGYVELSYQFASFIAFGTYKIRCEAQQTVAEKTVLVEFFLQKKIEVNVSLPFFINVESPTINGIVTANYTTGRGVEGLMRLTVRLKNPDESFEPAVNIIPVPDAPGPKLDYGYKAFDGRSDFVIPMSEAIGQFGDLINRELIFTATIFDPLWNETTNSSFLTSFYKTEYRIKFLNRQSGVFKPQMSYTANIAVINGDQSRFRAANFDRNTTYVRVQTTFDVDSALAAVDYPIPDDAIIKHAFIVPYQNRSMYMSIRAELFVNNEFIQTAFIEQRSVRYRSPSQTYIQITTSTLEPRIDNFMIFTVNISRYCSHVHYHIISASRIVYTDTIQMHNSRQQTVHVAVTRRMAPSAHILAYFIDYTGELVADVIHFHVSITSDTVALNLTVNQRKDLTGDTVELLAYGPPQARVAFAGTEYAQYQLYGGNDLLEMDIYNELYEYDIAAHPSPNITWYSNFLTPSEKIYRVGQSIAANVYRVFRSAGLFLLTDIDIVIDEEQEEKFCMELGNRFTCNDGSCYTISEKCDGVFNCLDGADELDCPEKRGPSFTPINKRLWPYWERFFTLSIAWESVSTYPDGRAQLSVDVPRVIGTWIVSAFSISQQNGLTVLPNVVTFEGTRQFFISMEIPGTVRLGEQIGVRVDVFNFQTHRIEALIILHASPHYRFINLDQNGQVSSFAPRTSEGYHHVLVILYPCSSRRIYIPILPLTIGSIDVTIEGITGVKQDIVTKSITVVYEGITNHFSTSTLISLEHTPRQMFELDIIVPENFILPLQNYFIYVPGSPTANIYISGDVAGPYFWEGQDKPLTSDNLIYKTVATAEGALIGFASMVYNIIYLRQGHGGKGFDQAKLVQLLDLANIEYNRMMAFYFDDQSDMGSHDGAFSNFGWKNETSVWLTSWILIALKDATQVEWEQYNLYIDPRVRAKSSKWLMTHQTPEGSWKEHSHILDREKFQSLLRSIDTDLPLNLSLTAQAVIALKMNTDINGFIKDDITDAIDRGQHWLEIHYHMIVDAFELAITTYALHFVNSPEKDNAFNMLISRQRTSAGGLYWANVELPSNRMVFLALNERLAPKYESELEAHAIASTSFALLTYIIRAQTSLGRPIVHWLQTRRNFIAGWCSSYDSYFALKSLVNYAIRRGDTIQQYNLRVNFSSSDDAFQKSEPILITDDNIIDVQQRSIQSVYGRAFIDAYGTGYALMQMKVQVNVEYPELIRPVPYQAFQMSLNVHLSNRYNYSYLLYQPCITWLPGVTKAQQSGWSIFTIEIPTGYRIEERYLKDLVGFGIVRNLRDAENYPNSLNFIFEFFDTIPICWEFELKRFIPVANMTRYYEMKAYEWHEPWSANRSMYTLRTLFGLDICSIMMMMMMSIIFFLISISSVTSIALDIRYPQFFHQSFNDSSVEITEGKSAGSFIAFVNLINDTNIIPNEWSLNITESDFRIQSNALSYSLITTQTLDRERKDFYEFSIHAQHLVPPYEKLSKLIRIRILDLNDCPPSFNQTIYQTSMIPNESTFTIMASDCDQPNTENSRVTYSLSNYQDLFRINESTGIIECIKNTNTYERYEIIVVARDHGKPSLSSTALVQIQLISSMHSRNFLASSSSWLHVEQNPRNILILASILATLFVFISLFICLICCIRYKIKRRKQENSLTPTASTNLNNIHSMLHERKFPSTSSTTSLNELQQHTANGQFTRITDDLHFERTAILYDAINVFPNTYYLPLKQQTELMENINNSNNNDTSSHLPPSSSSTTSSPVSATGTGPKACSDDGCYCSSDMSSEQSNNLLLLNASSLSTTNSKLSSKHVRFTETSNHIDGALQRFEHLYGPQTTPPDHCASYV